MTMEKTSGQSNALDQYVLLARSTKGAAAVKLIEQVLASPGIYVFSELLDMPNIKELSHDPEHSKYLKLLNIFAYGTFSDYQADKDSLPDLNAVQLNKLRHLTIVSLATKMKCIPYSVLLQELDLKNLRDLEDLIIDVVYADIIECKLDQRNNQLEVDFTIGRDIQPECIGTIADVLQEWCDNCETILANIEMQINKANVVKESSIKVKNKLDTEINNIKKTLKAQSQDTDDQINMDIREAQSQVDKLQKKQPKTKGLRGSAKFWQKS